MSDGSIVSYQFGTEIEETGDRTEDEIFIDVSESVNRDVQRRISKDKMCRFVVESSSHSVKLEEKVEKALHGSDN